MSLTVTVMPRVQTAAKKLPASECKILGEFIRQTVVLGVNPSSAASAAKARIQAAADQDKDIAYGGTYELTISPHHRVFYKFAGSAIWITNLVPVADRKS